MASFRLPDDDKLNPLEEVKRGDLEMALVYREHSVCK